MNGKTATGFEIATESPTGEKQGHDIQNGFRILAAEGDNRVTRLMV